MMTLPCRLLMINFQVFFSGEREQQDDKSYCNYLSSDAVPSLQLPTIYISERVGIIVTNFERTRLDFRNRSLVLFDMACDLLGRFAA